MPEPGGPDHQEVMTARSRDLDGEPAELVPPDVREIRAGQAGLGIGSRHDPPWHLAAQRVHELGEGRRDPDRSPVGEPRLGRAVRRHDDAPRRHGRGERDHARHPPQGPVEAELGQEGQAVDQRRFELSVGDQDADRDRQVEPGTTFAEPRWGKVDCDPLQRPPEAARQDGTAHPVSRLSARGIG